MDEKFPLALPEGTVLAGQYIIDSVLGQGGFGITYKATDHQTGNKVAVKEFFPDSMATRTQTTVIPFTGERGESYAYGKTCFLQEAETLAQFIGVESIVKIHSYFEENGTAYFVMDFVEGISFEEYIMNKGGKVNYEDAENVLLRVIDALAVVHSKGIVHRDVTPDNIYLTKDGTVKLLDFGAARYSLGDKSRSLDVVLKHGFAPKEQYTRHGKQGPYTDVYTVGASFYFAITGKRPPDSIDRIEEDDLIPPSSLGVNIPREKEDAILKALSVQPGERFQSMTDFKDALLGKMPRTMPVTYGAPQQNYYAAPGQPMSRPTVGMMTPGTMSPGTIQGGAIPGGAIPGGAMPRTAGPQYIPNSNMGAVPQNAPAQKKKKKVFLGMGIGALAVGALAVVFVIGIVFTIILFAGLGGSDTPDSYVAESSSEPASAPVQTSQNTTRYDVGTFEQYSVNNISAGNGYMAAYGDAQWYCQSTGLYYFTHQEGVLEIDTDSSDFAINSINAVDAECVVYLKEGVAHMFDEQGAARIAELDGVTDIEKIWANELGAFLIMPQGQKFILQYISWQYGFKDYSVMVNSSGGVTIMDDYLYILNCDNNGVNRILRTRLDDFGFADTNWEIILDDYPSTIGDAVYLLGEGGYIYTMSYYNSTGYPVARIDVANRSVDYIYLEMDGQVKLNCMNVYDGNLYFTSDNMSTGSGATNIYRVDAKGVPLANAAIVKMCETDGADPVEYWSISIHPAYGELWLYGSRTLSGGQQIDQAAAYMDLYGNTITEYVD